ncbi:MAG TPA: helix-turn-helix domain-containing protein [Pseudomonadota bacterium]|nr:helix-turn-helix domain-containing protein [Pseudomonadota bacterium]
MSRSADSSGPQAPESPSSSRPTEARSDRMGDVASDVVSDGRSLRAQRLRNERRLQILEVARQLFAQRGYHATSIQDLLDRADIARGTFYLHFDSKRAIFDELVDEFLARIRSVVRVVDLAPAAPPPLLQIESNLDRIFSVLQQNRDITRITLLMAEGLDAECDAKMADFYGRVLDLLCHALRLGQQMGLVRACDVSVVAQAALGGLKEVALQWIARRDSSEPELRHVAHEILAYTLHGLYLPPVTRTAV